jgi:hypothetical protein
MVTAKEREEAFISDFRKLLIKHGAMYEYSPFTGNPPSITMFEVQSNITRDTEKMFCDFYLEDECGL